MTERRPNRQGRIARHGALAIGALLVAAACSLPPGALDAPYPVQFHLDATARTVHIDAPGWLADESAVFLCPGEPPPLPEPGPERVGWLPGRPCHDFGRFASANGLVADLSLADLGPAERATFAAAPDWYAYLLDLDGETVTSATRSRFSIPDGFEAA
ncbi:MAG TPA: hypothetical protein VD763_03405 [Candidatus Saccharimonadales bacterium]|nr:hypothetical protein [Candidatus Saccharimonadales bacterium]